VEPAGLNLEVAGTLAGRPTGEGIGAFAAGTVCTLISDLDGTLLGHDDSLQAFADWCAPRRQRLRLVYNSGRLFDSIAEAVATTPLPPPDAVICGVGTEIRCFDTGLRLCDWPPSAAAWCATTVRRLLREERRLELQPDEFQSEWKVSYFAHFASAEFVNSICQRLSSAGLRFELIYSSQRDLDVLPAGVDKGRAAKHLIEQWRIDSGSVVVAGDTGNDIALFRQGFRGIVVGNGHSELRTLRDPSIYQAAQTCAAGVLEGLQHWFPELR